VDATNSIAAKPKLNIFMPTIEIMNPMPGGSWYTTVKKAHEYVRTGRAVIEDGMLRFIDRVHVHHTSIIDNPSFWNGSPKPKIMQKVSIKTIMLEEIGRGSAMHQPGEVRS
jgi:hypothetical protein